MAYWKGNKGGKYVFKSRWDNIQDLPHIATSDIPSVVAGFGSNGNEGGIFYDETADVVKYIDASNVQTLGVSAGSTLDGSYNADSGERTITVDDGTIAFDLNDASNDYHIQVDCTVDGTITNALNFLTSGGSSAVFTNAINVSDAGIVNALVAGANDLSGTNWSIAGATGKGTFVGLDAGAGDLTCGSSKFTVTHGTGATTIGNITGIASQALAIAAGATNQNLSLNANGSGTIAIGTTSTGDITIGDSHNANVNLASGTEIDLTSTTIDINGNADISGTLNVTGATTIGTLNLSAVQPASGNLTINGATGATTITIGNLSTGGIVISDNVTMNSNFLFSTTNPVQFCDSDLKIYSSTDGQLDIDADTELEIAAPTIDIDTSTAFLVDGAGFSIDATGASNVSVTGAQLQISTASSGELDITGVALVDINAGANLDIDVTGDFTMDATGTGSLASIGASDWTNDSGNLTLATTTSGNIVINSVALLDVDCVGNSGITTASGNFEINCTTSGVITLDGFSEIDFEIANADQMKYTTGSMEFQQATTIGTTSTNNLTITPGGDTIFGDGHGIVVGHTAQETTYSTPEFQILGTAAADSSILVGCFSTTATEAGAPSIDIVCSGNGTIGSHTKLEDNEIIGTIRFLSDDASDLTTVSAAIVAEVDDASTTTKQVGGALVFKTALGATDDDIAEKLRINAAGDTCVANGYGLFVGSETQCTVNGTAAEAQVLGTTSADASLVLGSFVGAASDEPPRLLFVKSRNSTIGSSTIHVDDDELGEIVWTVADGKDLNSPCAAIKCTVDEGAVAENKSGGDMIFYTTADGGETLTKALTIDSSQLSTFNGSVAVDTGKTLAMTDAGSITLGGEKVTAHKQVSIPVYATAGAAVSFGLLPIIDNCKITHISIGFVAVPASVGGTVLLEVYNRDGGAANDNLLNAATFDLESCTNMVTSDLTLTATTADLQPDDGDFVYCTITSNNGDMTGGTGGVITIKYTVD